VQTASHAAPPTSNLEPVLATLVGIAAALIAFTAARGEPASARPGYQARHAEAVR
jgi:hypothetical protein